MPSGSNRCPWRVGLSTRWGFAPRTASGHPLPVQIVECDVRVDEVFEEVSSAVAPVEPEVSGEERCCDHSGAVRKETFERQLPHRCVDDWHAGEAPAPCLQSHWVLTGPTSPFDVVGPRCFGSRPRGSGGKSHANTIAAGTAPPLADRR